MKEVLLSVVIPCYDEMANLRKGVLEKIDSFLRQKSYGYEVIIVDDGSKDGSVTFIQQFIKTHPQFKLIENPHFGKAGAITTGMLAAAGEFKLFTDMDQATPIEEIDNLLPFAKDKNFDIVIGSRSNKRKGAPIIRLFISRSNMIIRKLIVGLPEIDDTQCGFKLFSAKSAEKLFEQYKKLKNGFSKVSGAAVTSGFDVELLYIAKKDGYKIKEVSVDWLHVESRRVNVVKDSIKGVQDLLTIRRNIASGVYEKI